jgi:membrane-associated phospholipid phosphatase
LIILALIIIAFTRRASDALLMIGLNVGACCALLLLGYWAETHRGRLFQFIHNWYPVAAVFLVFKEVYVIIQSDQRLDWDLLLITIDRSIFGVHPTQWLGQFSFPLLTEILQIAYASYYFIMLTVGIEVFLRNDRKQFSYVLFVMVYGFFLSYLGYVACPAVGPRFTLHSFGALDTELPGLLLTSPVRDFLNAGESIPKGALNAIVFAQRDAFPSGHAQMTLISLYLARHYRLRSRFVLYFFGALLIISTVYLRYHYVVDVIGGVGFMLFTVWTAPKIFSSWERFHASLHPNTMGT